VPREQENQLSKIAITVLREGEGLLALLDGRFGRAFAFLIVDTDSGEVVETIENTGAAAAHGAGTGAAGLVRSAGVQAVISGRFGPKAFEALQALKIETWIAPTGITAGEALKRFREGKLEKMQMQVFR
jgi:predicted Fe-Mo cluster-binding NifX family protein